MEHSLPTVNGRQTVNTFLEFLALTVGRRDCTCRFCKLSPTLFHIQYPLEKGHLFYPYPQCTEIADRDLLPSFHSISVYPRKDLPFFIIFTAALFTITLLLAVFTHQVILNLNSVQVIRNLKLTYQKVFENFDLNSVKSFETSEHTHGCYYIEYSIQ